MAIDGQTSEDLRLFEGDDAYQVVADFVDRFDLADDAMGTLLRQLDDHVK